MKSGIIVALVFFTNFIFAQNYQLDTIFGDKGVSLSNFPGEDVFAIAYDGIIWDDSYLIECFIDDDNGESTVFIKYDKNGKIDESFADHGKLINEVFEYDGPLHFTILPNGNIALASIDSLDYLVIYEYDKNSKTDKIITIDTTYDSLYPASIISDDKNIYIGGVLKSDWISGKDGLFIMKTDLEGNIDSTFGENGLFILKNDSIYITLNALTFYDGGLLFSFGENDNIVHNWTYSLSKLDFSGELNQSFGNGGFAKMENIDFLDGDLGELNLDKDNNIYFNIISSPYIFKFDNSGNPVLTYGHNGVSIIDLNTQYDMVMGSSRIMDDGGIFQFGGTNEFFDEAQPLINKLLPSGYPDTTYGNNGLLQEYFGGNSVFYNGIMNGDGSFIAIGGQGIDGSSQNVLLAKYKLFPSATKEISDGISGLKVYPNPVIGNKFHVALDLKESSEIEISLFSITGKKINTFYNDKANEGENIFEFDVKSGIMPGTYLLKVMNKPGVRYKKISILD